MSFLHMKQFLAHPLTEEEELHVEVGEEHEGVEAVDVGGAVGTLSLL